MEVFKLQIKKIFFPKIAFSLSNLHPAPFLTGTQPLTEVWKNLYRKPVLQSVLFKFMRCKTSVAMGQKYLPSFLDLPYSINPGVGQKHKNLKRKIQTVLLKMHKKSSIRTECKLPNFCPEMQKNYRLNATCKFKEELNK